jgi:hypothetical protein
MEDKVLKRAMFMMPLKSGTMNSGIMQGFEDGEDDDEEGMDEEMSSAELTRRTPQSPEILMNNLRGDIRSVDARYEELAQMVGDQAAMDTPPEVLALLQGQMGQQPPQGGIGALPQAPQPAMDQAAAGGGIAEMMPQEAAPPMPAPQEQMAMPQEPLPTDQGMMPPPQGFARGGYVQHFADGSDEYGVTPAGYNSGFNFGPGSFQAKDVEAARSRLLNMANSAPIAIPSLESRVQARLPEYRRLLGVDQERSQARMLLDIAQAGLAFASNVDPVTGQPMMGSSFASRLAQASRALPATLSERMSDVEKAERAVSLAAIQAGEKDIEAARASQLKMADIERDALSAIVRAGSNPFKAFATMKDIDVMSMLAPGYKDGTLNEDGRRFFEARVQNYVQPEYIQTTDPVTGNISVREKRNELPKFVKDALDIGKDKIPNVVAETQPVEPATTGAASATERGAVAAPESQTTGPGKKTIWEMASDFTGPVPSLSTSTLLRPFTAESDVGRRQQETRSYVDSAVRNLIKNLQSNPRYPEGERKAIEKELDIGTNFWDSTSAMRNRLKGIDSFLLKRQEEADAGGVNDSLPKETRQQYRSVANELRKFREILMPPKVTTMDEVERLPSGTTFFWTDGSVRRKK